jgi:TetR/AcrR family transcriptional regulator
MPTPPKPSVTRARSVDPDTETRILEAARRVFTRRGTAGARMQEIAVEAGVNSALLYYYYRSKQALSERVFMDAASHLFAVMTPLAAHGTTIDELVHQYVHTYIDTVRDVPFLPGYVVAEMHLHPERIQGLLARAAGVNPSTLMQSALARIHVLLQEGIATGKIRPLTPRQALISVFAVTVMPFVARPILTSLLGMDDEAFEAFLDERRRELPDFILHGLQP